MYTTTHIVKYNLLAIIVFVRDGVRLCGSDVRGSDVRGIDVGAVVCVE